MRKTKRGVLYFFAALFAVVFVLACLAGFAACGGSDEAEVESVTVTSSVSVEEGKSATVTASVKMSDDSAYEGSYSWSSSDATIATVSGSGASATVTGVKEGSATVTVTAEGKSASCSVTVTAATPETPTVTSVALSTYTMTLAYGGTAGSLAATVTMSSGSYTGSYEWASDATGVATVAPDETDPSKATVTAVKSGTANITVTAGGVTSEACVVTVTANASGVTLNNDTLSLVAGGSTGTTTATVTMEDGSSYSGGYTWTTSDSNIATVSGGSTTSTKNRGTVTPVSAGTATITVTLDDDTTKATCAVTVTDPVIDGISLSHATLDLGLNSTANSETLTATVSMDDGNTDTSSTVTWTVTDQKDASGNDVTTGTSVVTVTPDTDTHIATVTAGSTTGTATVTATVTLSDGTTSYSATCDVTVVADLCVLEAENAALFNSADSGMGSTEILGTETSTISGETVGNVKNFNVSGDKIVYEVVASAQMQNITLELFAWASSASGMSGYSYDTYKNLITVNGVAVEYTGSFTTDYSVVTATASLNAGVNYIEITIEATGSSAFGMNMGGINVDKVELIWDETIATNATVTMVDMGGAVVSVASDGVAALDKSAYLANAKAATTSHMTVDQDGKISNVSAGDELVYQINAAAAVENVSLEFATDEGASFAVKVNGADVTASSADGTYAISLTKGVNYIEIVADTGTSGASVSGVLLNDHSYETVYVAEDAGNQVAAHWECVCSTCGKGKGVALTTGEGYTFEVKSEAELLAAVALDGATVVLSQDIALSGTMTIETTVTIDLAGNTLSSGTIVNSQTTGWTPVQDDGSGIRNDVMISVAEGGALTIVDTSSAGSGKISYDYTGSTIYKSGTSGDTYAWNNSANNGAAIEVDGGELVIESGTVESVSVGIRAKSGSVTIDGGLVYSSGYYVIWESDGEVDVTINDGIVAGAGYGILVDGDSNFGQIGSEYQYNAKTTLTVNGGTIYSGGTSQAAIRTEGMTSVDSATITVNGGEVISAGSAPAIFLANGTLTIVDGYIEGPTAVEIQAGKATIEGGTFVASYTGEQSISFSTSSASFTYGYALAIYARGCVRTTAEKVAAGFDTKVDVTVTGGTYVGDVLVSKTNAYAHNDDISSGTEGYFDRGSLTTADQIAAGNYSYVWTLNETDSEGNVNYKVDMTNSGITLTAGTVSYTGDNVSGTGNTDCLVYTYTDLTSNFVTGAYDQSAGVPEGVYTVGSNNTFTGSNITVERVGTTYIVNGTYGTMTQEQAAAFYNEDEATSHIGDHYIVVAIVAGAGETIQVKSSVNGTTYTLNGDSNNSDDTFYTLCFNVTNYGTDPDFDSLCFTIVVDGVEFDVVLGDITSAIQEETP